MLIENYINTIQYILMKVSYGYWSSLKKYYNHRLLINRTVPVLTPVVQNIFSSVQRTNHPRKRSTPLCFNISMINLLQPFYLFICLFHVKLHSIPGTFPLSLPSILFLTPLQSAFPSTLPYHSGLSL